MSKKKGEPRVRWVDSEDAILVATLRKGKDDGFMSGSGFKPQVWAFCVAALAQDPKDAVGPPKTAEKIQDHWGKSVCL
ncbi:hypothetical protein B0H15DRAFT_791694 [Mycena belliarum]|uniref:Myb-like domain-containing protein n=1 Tax=Mycena belliarum TaxID=1033014 RepID=A0AAD6TRV4_9AGAR|nr:hypothetical protein B0H15DRAFT_791694 [Mycena belliae]